MPNSSSILAVFVIAGYTLMAARTEDTLDFKSFLKIYENSMK
jgi:hypothetical protein